MATLHVELFSQSISKQTDFYVILPNDLPEPMRMGNPHYERPMKTLFLLHGYSGNNRDWLFNSQIMQLALKYNLAVVMPSGENSFYVDAKASGHQYDSLIAKDILNYVRKILGIAQNAEDTYIGGLSMGGFGALHIGLSHPNDFSKIIALSSALIVGQLANMKEDDPNPMANYEYYVNIFGDLSKAADSSHNPEILVKDILKNGKALPGIYMACGAQDFLIEPNRAFYKFLTEQNVEAEYHETPGIHNWDFWNAYIEPGIRWALELNAE